MSQQRKLLVFKKHSSSPVSQLHQTFKQLNHYTSIVATDESVYSAIQEVHAKVWIRSHKLYMEPSLISEVN